MPRGEVTFPFTAVVIRKLQSGAENVLNLLVLGTELRIVDDYDEYYYLGGLSTVGPWNRYVSKSHVKPKDEEEEEEEDDDDDDDQG